MTDLLLKLKAIDLARIAPFVADQDVRYYLNGVMVEPHPEGAVLVATNGHILAATLSKESYAASQVILATNKRLISEIRKAANARSLIEARVELQNAQSYVEVVASAGGVRNPSRRVEFVSPTKPAILEGKYPDWRKVLPKPETMADGLPGCVKADYVKLAVDAALSTALGKGRFRYHGVTFQHDGSRPLDSAIVIRSTDDDNLILVIMPMRDTVGKNLPAWASWTAPTPPPAAAAPRAEPEKAAA